MGVQARHRAGSEQNNQSSLMGELRGIYAGNPAKTSTNAESPQLFALSVLGVAGTRPMSDVISILSV